MSRSGWFFYARYLAADDEVRKPFRFPQSLSLDNSRPGYRRIDFISRLNFDNRPVGASEVWIAFALAGELELGGRAGERAPGQNAKRLLTKQST